MFCEGTEQLLLLTVHKLFEKLYINYILHIYIFYKKFNLVKYYNKIVIFVKEKFSDLVKILFSIILKSHDIIG